MVAVARELRELAIGQRPELRRGRHGPSADALAFVGAGVERGTVYRTRGGEPHPRVLPFCRAMVHEQAIACGRNAPCHGEIGASIEDACEHGRELGHIALPGDETVRLLAIVAGVEHFSAIEPCRVGSPVAIGSACNDRFARGFVRLHFVRAGADDIGHRGDGGIAACRELLREDDVELVRDHVEEVRLGALELDAERGRIDDGDRVDAGVVARAGGFRTKRP